MLVFKKKVTLENIYLHNYKYIINILSKLFYSKNCHKNYEAGNHTDIGSIFLHAKHFKDAPGFHSVTILHAFLIDHSHVNYNSPLMIGILS